RNGWKNVIPFCMKKCAECWGSIFGSGTCAAEMRRAECMRFAVRKPDKIRSEKPRLAARFFQRSRRPGRNKILIAQAGTIFLFFHNYVACQVLTDMVYCKGVIRTRSKAETGA